MQGLEEILARTRGATGFGLEELLARTRDSGLDYRSYWLGLEELLARTMGARDHDSTRFEVKS